MSARPTRPRLVDGLVLAPLDRGLVFDGAARRQVLRGAAASALLPRLLPLLDGSRPLTTLVAELPDISPATIAQAVTLLWDRGLVEEGSERRPLHAVSHPEVAAFVSRLVGSTSHNRNGDEALARLAAADVIVVADGGAAERLAAELTAAAIGRVRTATPEMLEASGLASGPGPRPLVVALEPSGVAAGRLSRLDDQCAEAQVPWLRTAIDSGTIETGPYFDGRSAACYRCFAADRPPADHSGPARPSDRADHSGPARPSDRADHSGPARPSDRALAAWASLVAMEVCYLTARIGRTVSTTGVTSLDLASWTSTLRPVIRRPGCDRCCPLPPGSEHPVHPAYRREQAGALPAPDLIELADHRSRATRAWPSLRLAVRPRTTHPGSGWTGGPDGNDQRHAGRPAPLSAARLNADLLAGVLGQAVTVTDPGQDPTTGAPAIPLAALSPVQAYVHVHRIVGLADGWHWWHSHDRVFVPVHTVSAGPGQTPGAVIALTASVAPLEESHGAAGHRLAHLASGRVAYALLDGLARAGMPARLRPAADDAAPDDAVMDPAAVAGVLGLDPATEPLTALIDLPAPRVSS